MRVERTLRRLSKNPDDKDRLAITARDVGHELPRCRLDILRKFRAILASCGRLRNTNDYTTGYLRALADIVAAYEAAIQPEDSN